MEYKNNEKRKGYHFLGWFIDEEGTKRINPGGILPSTVTLYDKWIPILYRINYELNGGMNSRMNPRYLTIESGVLRLYPARKKDMAFDYWSLNGKRIDVIPEKQCGEITLVAHYRPLSTVHFETNGGAIIQDCQVRSDGYLAPFRPPIKLGHDFCGWFYDPDFKKPFQFDQQIKESCTLYAKWDLTYYTICYRTNGGISSRKNPHVYTYFSPTTSLLPAKKKGYIFDGWFDARGNEIKVISLHSIGNKTLFAHYHPLNAIKD